MKNKKKIVSIIVNSRANYARIKSFLKYIHLSPIFELDLVVGASGLLYKYGEVAKIIEKDGFKISKKIYSVIEGGNHAAMAKTAGLGIIELSSHFEKIKPNLVVVVADRYENISIAIAASYLDIPLVHVQGGEVSGSIDEKVRHAITKLSDLHFVATERSKKFVEMMGENPKRVFVTGCPSLDLVKMKTYKFNRNLFLKTGVGGRNVVNKKKYVVVLQHPNTYEFSNTEKNILETVKAVSRLDKKIGIIWLWPNIDAGTDVISKVLRRFYEKNEKNNLYLCRNFEPEIFSKIIKNSLCLIGNSSSAIREGSFLGVPSVNIGTRQNLREISTNVINVDYKSSEILKAINFHIKNGHYMRSNLYGDGMSGKKMVDILSTVKISTEKKLNYLL